MQCCISYVQLSQAGLALLASCFYSIVSWHAVSVADLGFCKGGSEYKERAQSARDFLATPTFTLVTTTRDQKWRVLSSLLGSSLVNQTTPFPSTGCIASPARGREWSGTRD